MGPALSVGEHDSQAYDARERRLCGGTAVVREPVLSVLRGSMTTVRSRALVMVLAALALAACTSSQTVAPTATKAPSAPAKPVLAADLSAAPASWVSVAYGDVEISVPSTWWVFYPGSNWCSAARTPGSVYLGTLSQPPPSCAQATANAVFVRPIVVADLALEIPPAHYVNGLLVWDLKGHPTATSGTYMVPVLGVVVTADGPLTNRILATVARSPRSTALASGPAPSVPSSWRSETFAGLRFAVPANWPITRTQDTPGLGAICRAQGVAFSGTAVTLSTDERRFLFPPCPLIPPTPQQPENGVQVDSGLRTEPTVTLSLSPHCLDLHGVTACPATAPAYSILVLRVNVPGRDKPVFVSIGLTGNGMVARRILHSLRAA